MKTLRHLLLVTVAMVAALFITPTPAMAQSEDLGAILAANPSLQQYIGTSGCNPCLQTCYGAPFNGVWDGFSIWFGGYYIPWYIENYVSVDELYYWFFF